MIVSGDFKDSYNRPLDQQPVIGGSRSWMTAAFLCKFLGWFGVHRFYTGHVISGIFQFLTFGGFGIWVLVDLIMIYTDSFKDDMPASNQDGARRVVCFYVPSPGQGLKNKRP